MPTSLLEIEVREKVKRSFEWRKEYNHDELKQAQDTAWQQFRESKIDNV